MRILYDIMLQQYLYYKENSHLFISLLMVFLRCLKLGKRKMYCCSL